MLPTTRSVSHWFAAVSIAILPACAPEPLPPDDLPINGLSGSMGNVQDFHSDATVESSDRSVRLDSEDTSAHWWAMTRLYFADGNWRSMRVGTVVYPSDSRSDVSVVGCSGPRRDSWTYDQHGTVTEYRVGPGPSENEHRIYFTAVLEDRASGPTIHGAFVYTVVP